jgi:hypothetical protein
LVNPITATQEVAQSSLRLFPNPVGEVLTVAMESGIAGTILIRDVQGKLVQSWETNGETQVQIPTAALPAGFYVLVFNNLEKIQSTKFIKQ